MTSTTVIWLQLTGILALEIGVLAAVGAALHRVIRSAPWQRTLWQACLVATIAVVILELSGFARAFLPGSVNGAVSNLRPAQAHFVRSREEGAAGTAANGVVPNSPIKLEPSVMTAPPRPNPTIQRKQLALATREHFFAEDSPLILGFGFAWLAGTGLVLGRTFLGRILFVLLRHKWRDVGDAELQERAQALARKLRIRKRVLLIESPRFPCPVAFGVVHPTIGLPPGFATGFGQSQQEAMLMHELAHHWAGDPAWRWIADVASALLWWHPLVWWMRRRFEAASEAVADEASLLLADGPGALAECLLKLGAQFSRRQPSRSLGIAVTGFRSGLGQRVERLVHLKGRAWRPPRATHSLIARMAGALVLVLTSILCTAWTVPAALTKGENMQTMQHAWKSSLAAFALLTTLGTENQILLAGEPVEPASTPPVVDRVATSNPADPRQGQTLAYRWRAGAAATTPADTSQFTPAEATTASKERLEVEAKLKRIKLDTIAYDGVPLGEVVRHLGDTAAKLDPAKVGINFLIRLDTQPSPAVMPGAIDPTTGLPVASVPTESVDLNSVTVRIEPPLKQVRLCDVLDAITKVADHPIKYTVEDYGVVFSLDQSKISGPSFSMPAPELLFVQTFKVDTNTFLAGLDATFGIRVAQFGGPAGPNNIQGALHELLTKLGVNVDAQNKSIFYNQLTGILMVRGTQEDLNLVQAAIETLGGTLFSNAHGPPGFNPTAGIGARP
ncbi:MAG TPA: M56 family metallopeptidase [Verrucomicrobiae bacterium]|nr:M56 family metallopeptidase [Verrucomicrobiae bacterium]